MPFFGKIFFQARRFFFKEFSFGNSAGQEAQAICFGFDKGAISGFGGIVHFIKFCNYCARVKKQEVPKIPFLEVFLTRSKFLSFRKRHEAATFQEPRYQTYFSKNKEPTTIINLNF